MRFPKRNRIFFNQKKLKVHSNYSNSSTLINHSAYSGSHNDAKGSRQKVCVGAAGMFQLSIRVGDVCHHHGLEFDVEVDN